MKSKGGDDVMEKEKLYNIHDEYVELAFDMESMFSVVKLYEEIYLNKEKNEYQDMIRVIKLLTDSVKNKVDRLNNEFEEIIEGRR